MICECKFYIKWLDKTLKYSGVQMIKYWTVVYVFKFANKKKKQDKMDYLINILMSSVFHSFVSDFWIVL